MKVTIGPYIDWIGPFQLARMMLFWKDADDDSIHRFGLWLSGGEKGRSSLERFCRWVYGRRGRDIRVHIDEYDTWSMDGTLAIIALPMLRQLRDRKHGSARVDIADVPEELRYTETEEYDAQSVFDFYSEAVQRIDCDEHVRWEWVLGEMIWAMEQVSEDREGQFFEHPETPQGHVESPEEFMESIGKIKVDREGLLAYHARIDNGLRLFGRYYRGLWD